jgi:hypothetical protein
VAWEQAGDATSRVDGPWCGSVSKKVLENGVVCQLSHADPHGDDRSSPPAWLLRCWHIPRTTARHNHIHNNDFNDYYLT